MMDCSWDMNRIVSKDRIFSGDIIMLHMYTINDNHMIQGSWDIKCDRQNFLSCWAIFCPFTLVTVQKIKILKKRKKRWDIIITHKCNKNHDYMLYCSWDVKRDRCTCYFSFWANFILLTPPNSPKNQNLKKIRKKRQEISSFYTFPKNYDQMMYSSWDMVRDRWTDRRTDERTYRRKK